MTHRVGQCILLGAGSGDPGLLTRAGEAWLARAEVVVYDRLIPQALLALVPACAETIYVGKRADDHAMPQEQINQLLVDRVRRGQLVVRLKGGDPFIFGRGGEEARALREAGLAFRVVPGVTAALAGGAFAGIPLTDRRCASSVAFVTGHEEPGKADSHIDWAALAGIDTVVFYMGVERLEAIAEHLLAAGRSADVPAAVIQHVASPRQRVVVGTLGSIAREARQAGVEPPAITVVGEVVRFRRDLAWFEQLPLFGQTVLVTRSRPQASELSAALAEQGAAVIECPTIEVEPLDASAAFGVWLAACSERSMGVSPMSPTGVPPVAGPTGASPHEIVAAHTDSTAFLPRHHCMGGTPMRLTGGTPMLRSEQALGEAGDVERIRRVLVLTSPNGVRRMAEMLERLGVDARALAGVEIAAIGPGTAAALRSVGLRADAMPAEFTTRALGERLVEWLGADARRARVLLARAEAGSAELAHTLSAAGVTVTDMATYRTRCPAEFPPEAAEALANGSVDWITFASSSTVENFLALAKQAAATTGRSVDLTTIRTAAIGPVTAATLRHHGLGVDVQATDHTIPGLVEAMVGQSMLVAQRKDPFEGDKPVANSQ
ncbi:MAG: uroporphyrinogen-III C-methyltransferase [Phycisphaerae bacterium]|nr:uroporphyrinogen-III C-methyltransferase [Phycisphaerae bacterium]